MSNNIKRFWQSSTLFESTYECAWCPQRAEEQIFVVAGYSRKTAALTGPPRPSVYCLRKCLVDRSRALLLKMSWVSNGGRFAVKEEEEEASWGERTRCKNLCLSWGDAVWGDFRGWGSVVFQAKRAHGSRGLRMDSSRPPPRCQCYDMCTAPLFSLTTRALHLPGWPSLIKKSWFTCWGSHRPPSPLPVALTLHFLWASAWPSGVINNLKMEWGKLNSHSSVHPKEECLLSVWATWAGLM